MNKDTEKKCLNVIELVKIYGKNVNVDEKI